MSSPYASYTREELLRDLAGNRALQQMLRQHLLKTCECGLASPLAAQELVDARQREASIVAELDRRG